MKPNTLTALLAGILIGAGGCWLLKPTVSVDAAPQSASPRPRETKSARDDAASLERSRVAKRWIERMSAEGPGETIGKIPADDLKAVIEKIMSTLWGGMTENQQGQLSMVIKAWAENEPDAALAWARALEVPLQREIALASVAGTVGKKDPMAGFGIYSEIGVVNRQVNVSDLSAMMTEVYKIAMGKGAAAMVDIARRTPENMTNSAMQVQVDYPEDFDFAGLIDAMTPLGDPGSYDSLMKPLVPTEPLGEWATRDPDAAFDYVVSRTAEGKQMDFRDILSQMTRKEGGPETDQWFSGKLAAMEPEQAALLLKQSVLLHDSRDLRRYIAGMPEEMLPEFRYQVVRASPDTTLEILQDVPVEERVATIERLRDVKDTTQIRSFLGKWQVPQDRIEEIVRTVGSPAK